MFTFFISLIGWVLFRSENLTYAFYYLKTMFRFSVAGQPAEFDRKFFIILFIGMIFSFIGMIKGMEEWQQRNLEVGSWEAGKRGKGEEGKLGGWGAWQLGGWGVKFAFIVIFLLLCLASIISSGFNPFIYFRF
jgi:alginate O-acetyltransferase complex protein AlgI